MMKFKGLQREEVSFTIDASFWASYAHKQLQIYQEPILHESFMDLLKGHWEAPNLFFVNGKWQAGTLTVGDSQIIKQLLPVQMLKPFLNYLGCKPYISAEEDEAIIAELMKDDYNSVQGLNRTLEDITKL